VKKSELKLQEERCFMLAAQDFRAGCQQMRVARKQLLNDRILNQKQLNALQNVHAKADKQSLEAQVSMRARAELLGYTGADLLKALTFLRERAPLVIHLKLEHGILSDTHYRNRRELGGSRDVSCRAKLAGLISVVRALSSRVHATVLGCRSI
jgi:hypothetical protein